MTTKAATAAVEAAEPVLEEVAKVLDEQIDTVARIPRLRLNGTTRSQQIVILGVTAALGAAAGSAVTYKIVKKKLSTEYERLLDEGIEEAKEYYKRLNRREEYADPEVALSKYAGEVAKAQAELEEELPEGEEAVVATEEDFEEVQTKRKESRQTAYNLFSSPPPDFDPVVTQDLIEQGLPHVISYEEYMTNENEFGQVNATYYAYDGILAGEDDIPIEGVDALVGEDNLNRFGQLSKDANVVFVRNPRTRTEYEIVRSNGSFAKEVHGVDPEPEGELRHSHRTQRRYRERDD